MHHTMINSWILILLSAVAASAATTIDGGIHYVLPNDQRTIAITVIGGDVVEGIDFYVQLADGGPVNGGNVTAPKITDIDLVGLGTLFSQSNNGSHKTSLPDSGGNYLIWADSVTTKLGASLSAIGTLANIKINTTAALPSNTPYVLSFAKVADIFDPPGYDTTFVDGGSGELSPTIIPGKIIVTNLRDLTWNADRNGSWTETTWDGTVPGFAVCPNYTSRVIVNSSYDIQVTSAQAANQLTLSGGSRVTVGSAASLTVTTSLNVNAAGTLALVPGAGLMATSINVTGGTISGSGTVSPPVTLAAISPPSANVLAAPATADMLTLQNPLTGPGGLTKEGNGTVVLQGNAIYQGDTFIKAGWLQLRGAASVLHNISGNGNLQVGGGSASATLTATSIQVNTLIIGDLSRAPALPVPEPSTGGLIVILLCVAAIRGRLCQGRPNPPRQRLPKRVVLLNALAAGLRSKRLLFKDLGQIVCGWSGEIRRKEKFGD